MQSKEKQTHPGWYCMHRISQQVKQWPLQCRIRHRLHATKMARHYYHIPRVMPEEPYFPPKIQINQDLWWVIQYTSHLFCSLYITCKHQCLDNPKWKLVNDVNYIALGQSVWMVYKKNKIAKLKDAKEHGKKAAEYWQHILWSDKTKIMDA